MSLSNLPITADEIDAWFELGENSWFENEHERKEVSALLAPRIEAFRQFRLKADIRIGSTSVLLQEFDELTQEDEETLYLNSSLRTLSKKLLGALVSKRDQLINLQQLRLALQEPDENGHRATSSEERVSADKIQALITAIGDTETEWEKPPTKHQFHEAEMAALILGVMESESGTTPALQNRGLAAYIIASALKRIFGWERVSADSVAKTIERNPALREYVMRARMRYRQKS